MKDLTASDWNRDYFLKNRRLIFLLAGTLLMTALMAIHGAALTTAATPKGILDLEFTYNGSRASSVLNAWTDTGTIDNVALTKMNTWLDFIYLTFYSLFFYHACNLLADCFDGPWVIIGRLLAKGAIAAGLLDVVENTGMLLTLNGHLSAGTLLLTFIASISKWALVIAAILYVVLTINLLILRKTREFHSS